MEIIFSVTGNILIAELFGELDHHGAERVRERIDKAMDSHRSQKLILDFTKVTFMDSSGIGMILGRYRRMGQRDGNMAICSCSKQIRNILNMAGVFSIIDYYDTKDEATGRLNGKEIS